MTTHNYAAVLDHTSDAGFRAHGSALSAGLAAAGLVQTADTGQINWVTVNRPASNTVGGYEIWRLPSSALYFKIEWSTQTSATSPGFFFTVGTGSNGSGTLTGQLSTRTLAIQGNITMASSAIAYTTFICVTNDGLHICHAHNGLLAGTPASVFCAHRSVDASGATTTTGYKVICSNSTNGAVPGGLSSQDVRTTSPAFTQALNEQYCFAAGSPTSGVLNNGDNEVWLCWSDFKDGMIPSIMGLGYVSAEWTEATTKVITPFGSTSHTYLAIGPVGSGGTAGPVNRNTAGYGYAMLWD